MRMRSSSQPLTIDSHSNQEGVSNVPVESTTSNGRHDSFKPAHAQNATLTGRSEAPANSLQIASNYDVITDHDLSRYGKSVLLRYQVVLSGSHPKYSTYAMLDAYDMFLGSGRFFIYLCGNGYYLVASHADDPERTH
ncbi:hypothetical protein DM02DRAFT_654175 [Periconia macrospinosa]|uniref:N,N-dimethylformamidase beta subunit-like C-terminal domain-containing protein n=1 Tax=Periconia macrospinosa TaxID=97972 RepID=A0A2V1DUS9_9PLEO|nr:hypothetical protein DM02DRAFT_654175 [Periconia macrospinosa]